MPAVEKVPPISRSTRGRGIRLYTAKAFLKPASKRPNLTIVTGCHVERLLFDDTGRARLAPAPASPAAHGPSRRRRTARPLLAAGAVGSPQILQLSGIGDADELRRHGVDPVVDLPGVGNLQDHLQ